MLNGKLVFFCYFTSGILGEESRLRCFILTYQSSEGIYKMKIFTEYFYMSRNQFKFSFTKDITLSILFINLFMWLHVASKCNNIFFLTISKQPYEKKNLFNKIIYNSVMKSVVSSLFLHILLCLFDRAIIIFFVLLTLSFFCPEFQVR